MSASVSVSQNSALSVFADSSPLKLAHLQFLYRTALSYFYCYAISVASELSAAAVLVSFWAPDLSPAVTISVGLFALIALNFVGVNWYGESEVIFSSIKILLFVGLIILGM